MLQDKLKSEVEYQKTLGRKKVFVKETSLLFKRFWGHDVVDEFAASKPAVRIKRSDNDKECRSPCFEEKRLYYTFTGLSFARHCILYSVLQRELHHPLDVRRYCILLLGQRH